MAPPYKTGYPRKPPPPPCPPPYVRPYTRPSIGWRILEGGPFFLLGVAIGGLLFGQWL